MKVTCSLLLVSLLSAKPVVSFQPAATRTAFRYATKLQSTTTPCDDASLGNRRTFLLSGPFAAATLASLSFSTPSFAAGSVDYKAVAEDIAAMIKEDPDRGPTLVRLAWHSSGTYDKMSKDGGSGGGTMRFKEELAHGGNAGLADTAVKWMDPIYAKYSEQGLSYADLYTLGGGKYRCIPVLRSHWIRTDLMCFNCLC